MSYKFIGNIYDPEQPDAIDKLLSKDYGYRGSRRLTGLTDSVDEDGFVVAGKVSPPPKPEWVLKYVKEHWLKDKRLGTPIPPINSSLTKEDLINQGFKGVYAPTVQANRRIAPSTGTGSGPNNYPKHVRCAMDGTVLAIISEEHTV